MSATSSLSELANWTPSMEAIYYEQYGDLNVLQFTNKFKSPTIDDKPNKNDEKVLVRIVYTSVNPLDYKIREGFFKNVFINKTIFPVIPSVDMSGIVVKSQAPNFKVGDEVFGINGESGCMAEFSVMNAKSIAHKPREMSHAQASTIPLIGLTAHQSLSKIGDIKPGQKVLILGASGNVGSYCVEYAKNVLGAKVYAVCSTREGFNRVKKLDPELTLANFGDGSHNVPDSEEEDDNLPFEYNVPDVDVIIDCMGDDTLRKRTWRLLKAKRGKYIQIGLTQELTYWKTLTLGTFISWRKFISALHLGPDFYLFSVDTKNQSENLSMLAQQHIHNKITIPSIVQSFNELNLENAKSAFGLAESGKLRGKIVLQVCKLLPHGDKSRLYLKQNINPQYRFDVNAKHLSTLPLDNK